MPIITFTLTAGDAARVTALATSLGFPDAKTMIVSNVVNAVSQFEQRQLAQTYNAAPPAIT